MKKFFHNMRGNVGKWMAGRYGMDELSRMLSFVGCGTLILSCFEPFRVLYFPAFIIWAISIFRSYSRNIYKRQAERTKYLRFIASIWGWFAFRRRKWKERKTHKYIRCKSCRKSFRVPRGKGKIKIRCPHCQTEIIKKT